MTKHKNTDNLIALIIITTITFCFFGGYIHDTWQTDMYAQSFYTWESFKNMFLSGARFAQIVYVKICFMLNHNPAASPGLHISLALLINIFILYQVWKTLYSKLGLQSSEGVLGILLLFILLLTRVNVFQTDILQFGYSATVTYLGDAFALAAALLLYQKPSWKAVPLSGLLLIISSSFMQQTIFWFALWSVIFLAVEFLKPQDSNSNFFIEVLKRIAAYGCACFWQLFCFTVLLHPQGGRGDLSHFNLKAQLLLIYDLLKQLLYNCMGIQPKYFYFSFLLVTVFVIIFVIGTSRLKLKDFFKYAVRIALLFSGCFLAVLVPCFFDTWLAHRTVSGFSTLLPLLFIILFLIAYRFKLKWSKLVYLYLTVAVIVNLGVNWFYTSELYRQQIVVNAVDSRDVLFYYTEIENYEKQTGNTVTKLAWGFDSNPTNILPGTVSPKSINDRVMETPWGRREIMPFLFDRRFEIVEMPPDIWAEYFVDKDWDVLSEEQVVCIGDTAFVVWY